MMKNDPARSAPDMELPRKKSLARRVGEAIIHNWAWKLVCLVLAVCLWGILITQDTSLPRTKQINGVRVSVTNTAALRSNGLIVVSGLENLTTVNLKASVPQSNYTAAAAANYMARLDVSQIQQAGEQTLRITATAANASQFGTVVEIENPEVTLQVEEYASLASVPVEARRTGEAPEGLYAGAVTRAVESVDIGGPKSVVDRVARCVVLCDQSTLDPQSSPNTAALPFFFEDAEGNVLNSANLTVTAHGQAASIQRISVSQDVYWMARVPVDAASLIRGEPASGYTVSEVRVSPATVTLAGSYTAIAPYLSEGAALYPYDQVDISGQNRPVSQLLYLNTPGNMDYISNNAVQVVVTILPEEFGEIGGVSR